MRTERAGFYRPEDILKAAGDKMEQLKKAGERVDFITFVADGELRV